jgi:hypothetical protein
MYEDPSRIVERELQPGEQLLWADQPVQGLRLSKADIFLIPFSLFWGGFSIFWTIAASMAPFPMWIFGLPFVGIGVYIMVGRFFYDAHKRKQTFYGVTDQRILVVCASQSRKVQSLDIGALQGLSLEERADSRGSILFGNVPPMFSWVQGTGWPMGVANMPMCFDTIEYARKVHDLIRDIQQKGRAMMSDSAPPYAQPDGPADS